MTPRPAHGDYIRIASAPAPTGAIIIRFTIVSGSDESVTALVNSRPCGRSSVPEEDDYGQVEVYDPAGCFFDEEAADLVDRVGFATYQKPANYGEVGASDPGTDGCWWEVFSLCCPP